jgi:hypothetical protein
MPDIACSPFSVLLFKEETESAVAFCVDFAFIDNKSLSDCSFHFRDSAIALDVGRTAVNSVHDERASIHSCF